MGLLVDGQWHNEWYDTSKSNGEFVRKESSFRNWVTATGEAGLTGVAGFKAEAGRYHLYVSLACPWAHRTMIMRQLKGLEGLISVSVVNAIMRDEGWTFELGDDVVPDNINNAKRLHEVYTAAKSDYTGRVTVPVLWDTKLNTIVSNESADIMRMFNSAFDLIGAVPGDYYPTELQADIDEVNEWIYHDINNGVYKAGFATTQSAYTDAVSRLFKALDIVEQRLSQQRYLAGDSITEADWRLFTTLIRFDAIYVGHFKCNLRRIEDYPAISNYLRELYQYGRVAETVNLEYSKAHYYGSHDTINPHFIVPVGPLLDFTRPHNRSLLVFN